MYNRPTRKHRREADLEEFKDILNTKPTVKKLKKTDNAEAFQHTDAEMQRLGRLYCEQCDEWRATQPGTFICVQCACVLRGDDIDDTGGVFDTSAPTQSSTSYEVIALSMVKRQVVSSTGIAFLPDPSSAMSRKTPKQPGLNSKNYRMCKEETAHQQVIADGLAMASNLVARLNLSKEVERKTYEYWHKVCDIREVAARKKKLYRTEALICTLIYIAAIECKEPLTLKEAAANCSNETFHPAKTLQRVLKWLRKDKFPKLQLAEAFIHRYIRELKLKENHLRASLLVFTTFRDYQHNQRQERLLSTAVQTYSSSSSTAPPPPPPSTPSTMVSTELPFFEPFRLPPTRAVYRIEPNSPVFLAMPERAPSPHVIEDALMHDDATRRDPKCLAVSCIYTALTLGQSRRKVSQTTMASISHVSSNAISKTFTLLSNIVEQQLNVDDIRAMVLK